MNDARLRRLAVWVLPTAIVLAVVIPLAHTDIVGGFALAVAVLLALAVHGLLRDYARDY